MSDDDTGWDLNIVGEIFDASLAADLDDPGPLAFDREPVGPPVDIDIDRLVDQYTEPCPTCGGTGQITRPHPHDHARFPRRPITRDCPNCTDRKPT